MIKFTIDEVPPSLNKLIRMHYYKRMELQKNWDWQVKAAIMNEYKYFYPSPENANFFKRKVVHITLYRKRLLDDDNAVGGAKCLIDALKHNSVIYDDRPQYAKIDVKQIKSKEQKTEISIEVGK